MHIIFLPQQLGLLGGKGVDLHPCGSKKFPPMTWVVVNMVVDQIFPTYATNLNLVPTRSTQQVAYLTT
jgi:hypothetical protein